MDVEMSVGNPHIHDVRTGLHLCLKQYFSFLTMTVADLEWLQLPFGSTHFEQVITAHTSHATACFTRACACDASNFSDDDSAFGNTPGDDTNPST